MNGGKIMTFKHYIDCIDSGFPEKHDLEVFIKAIEGDEEISDRQYEYLRRKAIERFYEWSTTAERLKKGREW